MCLAIRFRFLAQQLTATVRIVALWVVLLCIFGSSVSAPELKRQRRRLRFILQIAISAALGGFLFGYDTAVINGAVGAIGEVFQVS